MWNAEYKVPIREDDLARVRDGTSTAPSSNMSETGFMPGANVGSSRYSTSASGVDGRSGFTGSFKSWKGDDGIGDGLVNSVSEHAYSHAARLGSKLLEEGNKLLYNAQLIGEGPKPLRALCFLGGLAMTISSFAYIFFVFSFLTGPAVYVLHIYEMFFGIIAMIIEAKDMACLEAFKSFVGEWLKFMTVPGGKGAFYLFSGSLGISMFSHNLALFVVGCYMVFLGVVCTLVHCGLQRQLRQTGLRFDDDEESPTTLSPTSNLRPPVRPPSAYAPSLPQPQYDPLPVRR